MRIATPGTTSAWVRVALVMFAVGWGANQFSPMLIVYRHALGLGPGEIAGLFAIYAATLIPGLLAGGPLSDRFGRRACVLPFAALSPVATLLLVLRPRDLALVAAGRALAGLCSGMVFGPATAWVQDLSGGSAASARRSALALSAGFGLGPVVAALLAQWAGGDPLVVPYLPHLVLGVAAFAAALTAPSVRSPSQRETAAPRVVPGALRTRAFWLAVAPAAPFVFGSMALAIVVLPEEVTSARSLSAAYAGLMILLAFAAGIAVQPAARVLAARDDRLGIIAGLGFAAAGAAVSVAAVAGPSRALAGLGAVLLGLAYGLCLVCGLHEVERLTGPRDRGTVLACYYVLAYLGFCAPYGAEALNAAVGKPGAFAVLAVAAAALTAVMAAGQRTGLVRLPGGHGGTVEEHASVRKERVSQRNLR